MNMRKLLLLCLFLFGLDATAQTVGYSFRPLAAEGCNMKYSVTKQDSAYYIIVTVRSDRMKFLKESTFLIKNFDGEIIRLQGDLIGNGSESAGIMAGNIMIPVTEINSTAQFRISPEQFELIKNGIAKVRLSTIPIKHERTFKKDKIGKKLYQFYLKAKSKADDF